MIEARRRAFTLIELIAVIVILAVLAGVALPRYFDQSDAARASADEASIGGINTALALAFTDHRVFDAPAAQWITDVDDIPSVMYDGILPTGLTVDNGNVIDQRGNVWTLVPETATDAARLELDGGGGGGGGDEDDDDGGKWS